MNTCPCLNTATAADATKCALECALISYNENLYSCTHGPLTPQQLNDCINSAKSNHSNQITCILNSLMQTYRTPNQLANTLKSCFIIKY